MPHLPSERFAELADGECTAAELEHLARCNDCNRELESHRRLMALAADERLRIAPPLTEWEGLSARLRTEGLLRGEAAPAATVGSRSSLRVFRRAAAVVVLVGAGALLGRMTATGGGGVPPIASFREAPATDDALFGGVGDAMYVANGNETFTSPEAALATLERAQRAYEAAAVYLASYDTTTSAYASERYRTRLAALDRTAETMHQAMRDAPEDPLINQYYLATMNAREQTMRRLGTVLPVGNRLGRF